MGISLEAQFANIFGTAAGPALKAVAIDEIQQQPDIRSEIASVESMDREITQWTKVASFGKMTKIGEGELSPSDKAVGLGMKTFTALKFSKSCGISREMIEDQRFDMINKMVRALGRSAYDTQQANFFNILNNGFVTETAFDAVAVFSTSHPTQSGLQSNLIGTPADISYAGIKEGENYFRKLQDERGKQLIAQPSFVLTSEDFRHDALEIVNTPFKPGSANNDINSLSALKVLSSPYITDLDSWFMGSAPGSESNGFMIYNRKPLDSMVHEDVLAGVMYYVAEYRQALGVGEWRGLWASAGG